MNVDLITRLTAAARFAGPANGGYLAGRVSGQVEAVPEVGDPATVGRF